MCCFDCMHVWNFNCACCQTAYVLHSRERRRKKLNYLLRLPDLNGTYRIIYYTRYECVVHIFIIYYYYISLCVLGMRYMWVLLFLLSTEWPKISLDPCWLEFATAEAAIYFCKHTHERARTVHSNNKAKSMGHSQYDMIFGVRESVCVCTAHVRTGDMKGNRWIINAFTTSTRITAANGINTSSSPICSGCSGHVHNEKNKFKTDYLFFSCKRRMRKRSERRKNNNTRSKSERKRERGRG